jgi:proton-translocating NADH-quinone oxidoreductase chain L
VIILSLPLLASICLLFFGFLLGTKGSAVLALIAFVLTLGCSINYFLGFISHFSPSYLSITSWLAVDLISIDYSLRFDSLTILMALLVSLISMLVYAYSLSYLIEDPHLIRFSAYLLLFTFFMLLMVFSDNLIQLFFGWEGIGLFSYLLISFWYQSIESSKAALQAVMLNKIGDIALLLAISSFWALGSVNFDILPSLVSSLANNEISSIAFFILVGIVSKSAQLGLHAWLPSAMAGPTPVSALLHAATMVAAGIFLFIRCSFLFELASTSLVFATLLGAATTFFAASVGLLQNDLKRIIAYSTCSQLGYLLFSCGLSNYTSAYFHLLNHAFFKALLFLSAGSIIHGLDGEQDIRRMGGLLRLFPSTYTFFLIGSLALAGFPFLAGFYSKDFILEGSFCRYSISSFFSYWLASAAAFLTAFYSFRLLRLVFFDSSNSSPSLVSKAHEASIFLLGPLIPLAFGSVVLGFLSKDALIGLGSTLWGNEIFILPEHFTIDGEFTPFSIKLVPTLASFLGLFLAIFFIQHFTLLKVNLTGRRLYSFFNQRWLFEPVFNYFIISSTLSVLCWRILQLFERGFIELTGPSLATTVSTQTAHKISLSQTGLIYHHLFSFLLGIILLPLCFCILDFFNLDLLVSCLFLASASLLF